MDDAPVTKLVAAGLALVCAGLVSVNVGGPVWLIAGLMALTWPLYYVGIARLITMLTD